MHAFLSMTSVHAFYRPSISRRFRLSTATAIAIFWLVGLQSLSSCLGQGFVAKKESDRVDFFQNGKLITSYHFKSGTKPILYPLVGPDEVRMSRDYPMGPKSEGGTNDHVHHRSLWMTFGEVNDSDFWAEGKNHGEVIHKELLSVEQNANSASVKARHIWQSLPAENKPGKPIVEEVCKYTVSGTADERIIDCEYILRHAPDADKSPIHFGDTKEGMFAIRVPDSMKVDNASGQILNSKGQKNGDAWGKIATWVEYNGKVTRDAEKDYGIAILIHPKGFGSDGYWHVRTYGLFAHNPIGVKDFLQVNPNNTKKTGGIDLKYGDSMHMKYRVILHRGRWTGADAEERYKAFAPTSLELK